MYTTERRGKHVRKYIGNQLLREDEIADQIMLCGFILIIKMAFYKSLQVRPPKVITLLSITRFLSA